MFAPIDVNEYRKGGMSIGDACAEVVFSVATYRELRNGRTKWFNEYMAEAGIPALFKNPVIAKHFTPVPPHFHYIVGGKTTS